jgi:CDGSH-type Zn-finger protein
MADRVVGGCKPIVGVLEPGTYWWCDCGRSKTQPFCDGSHEGTGFEPRELVVTEAKKYALCTCKMSAHAPLCDGTHKTLSPEIVARFTPPPSPMVPPTQT